MRKPNIMCMESNKTIKTLSAMVLAGCISLCAPANAIEDINTDGNSYILKDATADDYTFESKTADSKGNITSKFYKIELKPEILLPSSTDRVT